MAPKPALSRTEEDRLDWECVGELPRPGLQGVDEVVEMSQAQLEHAYEVLRARLRGPDAPSNDLSQPPGPVRALWGAVLSGLRATFLRGRPAAAPSAARTEDGAS